MGNFETELDKAHRMSRFSSREFGIIVSTQVHFVGTFNESTKFFKVV